MKSVRTAVFLVLMLGTGATASTGGSDGNDWWRHLGTKPDLAPRAKLIALPPPVAVAEPAAMPELGSSKDRPIVLHSEAQADLIPDGRWVLDSRGVPFQILNHRHPTPAPTPVLANLASPAVAQQESKAFDSEGLWSAIDMVGMGLVLSLLLLAAWKVSKHGFPQPANALEALEAQERKAARAEKLGKLGEVAFLVLAFVFFVAVFHTSPLIAFLIVCGIGPCDILRSLGLIGPKKRDKDGKEIDDVF